MTQVTIWTSEAINALMDLIKDRYSATMIGEVLTTRFGKDFTRNAVVGKIHRLKIGKKEKPVIIHQWTRTNSMAHKASGFYRDDEELLAPPKTLNVYIGQLDSTSSLRMCRYPERDEAGVMTYCGLPTVEFPDKSKCSWCAFHHMFVTQPLRA